MLKSNGKPPLIIAHRGFSATAPENSLIAFRKALEAKADGIEMDVRLTRELVPIVFHDQSLKRVASFPKPVSALSLDEIRKVNLGLWFNRRFPSKASNEFLSERIPTLEEALILLENHDVKIYLELKASQRVDSSTTVEKVLEVISKKKIKLSQLVFKSFEEKILRVLRERLPEAKIAALFAPKLGFSRKKMLSFVKQMKVDEVSIHFLLANRKLVKEAKSEGLKVIVWTVNDPIWLQRAIETRIDAVITNDPLKFKLMI
ncbi:MAG: glycerophosphodiester phosphodiesterase family protein [Pyrinomonadaceae bacterium]|nr:hypothetical protein [Pyrinomonadaceae bacterium]MCX7639802.1 glycerophosphodiester phosphodiesterase family protein [Pyrinomonadaceae bacterium]MDW8304385.1 glycerophosphodiester phosphodiesterase family protein [Acidobacteriota bacterium]